MHEGNHDFLAGTRHKDPPQLAPAIGLITRTQVPSESEAGALSRSPGWAMPLALLLPRCQGNCTRTRWSRSVWVGAPDPTTTAVRVPRTVGRGWVLRPWSSSKGRPPWQIAGDDDELVAVKRACAGRRVFGGRWLGRHPDVAEVVVGPMADTHDAELARLAHGACVDVVAQDEARGRGGGANRAFGLELQHPSIPRLLAAGEQARALFRALPGVLARIVELDECFGKARSGDPRALGLWPAAAATVVPACGCEPASRELPFDAPPIEAVFRERGAGLSVAELGLHVLAECARMVGDHQAVPAESFVLARFMLEPAEQSSSVSRRRTKARSLS